MSSSAKQRAVKNESLSSATILVDASCAVTYVMYEFGICSYLEEQRKGKNDSAFGSNGLQFILFGAECDVKGFIFMKVAAQRRHLACFVLLRANHNMTGQKRSIYKITLGMAGIIGKRLDLICKRGCR